MPASRTNRAPETPSLDEVEGLTRELARARATIEALDRQNRELEQEVVRRGVKLSCARIALARAKIAFDESTRQREEMVEDVAHDLRTPLTSVKGAAQNLLDGVAGPLQGDAREYVEIVREHADRLIGAVNWLLEAMRAASQSTETRSESLDVGELCESVVHGLRPIAQERGVELVLQREPAVAVVDATRLRQVFENLIGNALKFTEAGGTVEVHVTALRDTVSVRVRDTGIGMDRKELDSIFQRYYRRRADNSSGLGLVIARENVRLHGGEIRVQSEPGKGSEFTVYLPCDGEVLCAASIERARDAWANV
jgi:two-component system, OmpR family, phosphate regulon sensor histidine kinase PhoR